MEAPTADLSFEEHIRVLLIRIEELTKALQNEMAVNENLADQNVFLKRSLDDIKARTKVFAHPSTIKTLSTALADSENRVEQIREALIVSLSLIPDVSSNRHMVDRLRKIAQSY